MAEDQLHLARLKKGENVFEVSVDPDKAMEYRQGADVSLSEVVKNETVWFDAKKGLEASQERLQALFETDDNDAILDTIIRKGEIQLSAEYREKRRNELYKSIVNRIQRNAVDPKTNNPHPRDRIEAAMEEAKVGIVEHKSAEEQIDDIVKKLKPVLPLKMVVKHIQIKLPADVAAKAYGTVTQFGNISDETWLNDGSWMGVVKVPGGMEADFYEALNKVCHCEVEATVMKTE